MTSSDHLIAEVNTSGQTMREYIRLDDLPVAVVDGVQTGSPTIYYGHVDHLKRLIRMTNQSWGWVWDVKYAPFGATTYVWSNPAVMNARFPGQWFQIESGLTVNGLPADTLSASYGSDGRAIAKSMGWKEAHDIIMNWAPSRPVLQDGPSVFGYVDGHPTSQSDRSGLLPNFTPIPPLKTNLNTCGDARSDLLDSLARGKMKGVDPCYALDMLWGAGFGLTKSRDVRKNGMYAVAAA